MRPLALVLALALLPAARPARAAAPPAPVDAEPLIARLTQAEQRGGTGGAAAARELAQLRYARGEYLQAAEVSARAAARASGAERGESLYWGALANLAAGRAAEAERGFTEAARLSAIRRPLAQLGLACALESRGRPERAFDALSRLLAGDPGEAGPAALERYAVLADRLHRDADAARARESLRRRWARSFEAARLSSEALR